MIKLSIKPALAILGTGTASIALAALLATPASAHPAATPTFIGSTTGLSTPTTITVPSTDPTTPNSDSAPTVPSDYPTMPTGHVTGLCPNLISITQCTLIKIYNIPIFVNSNKNIPVAVDKFHSPGAGYGKYNEHKQGDKYGYKGGDYGHHAHHHHHHSYHHKH
jgi:hypothetical protein